MRESRSERKKEEMEIFVNRKNGKKKEKEKEL